MFVRIPALTLTAALAVALALSVPARAQDMKGMDMSGHDMSDMSMSGDSMMDHDVHMDNGNMKNMALHMAFTDLRPANDADKARAAVLVTDLQHALAKYKDYHVAEADGFKPFHPELKQQKVVHFTKNWYGLKAMFTFNTTEPTSLLYERTPDGGYKLIGAMYTDRKDATLDQLNQRVPLSVARWHRHINFCFPPKGADMKTADWTKFGMGSIATKEACDAVGGRFYPQIFGWMVHVYPWETNPQLVWAH
ncbi:hypothetical protein [Candidatus Binatus sp.]|jgi:hypothetical protein|uniref:hypothetical protein n=1 Tax=Candidatus Binatus sp. TaxID=2811406 RepID=UPI003C9D6727